MQRVGQALGFGVASVSPRASPRRAIQKVSCALHGSNTQWCGLAFAALPDSSKPKKQGKRLPKQERRLLVEKFVHKYRASNNGKFPGVQLAKNEVGGSYYVIREIIQELEYEHKCLGVDKIDEFQLESMDVQNLEATDEQESVVEVQDVPIPVAEPSISLENSVIAQDVTPVKDVRSSDSSLIREAAEKGPELSQTHRAGIAKGVAEDSSLENQVAASITAGNELSTVSSEAHVSEDSTADQTVLTEGLCSSLKPESVVNDMPGPGEPPADKEIENTREKLLDLDITEQEHPCGRQEGHESVNLQRRFPFFACSLHIPSRTSTPTHPSIIVYELLGIFTPEDTAPPNNGVASANSELAGAETEPCHRPPSPSEEDNNVGRDSAKEEGG
ncbi:hypothetical protein EJ110_NYTH03241 [Nymphaea thermarum]|nr:hypothetical protein EJ110_NYTH03241 [Nymphaea thermarum]